MSMSGAGKAAASEIESSTGRIGSAIAGIASSGNLAVAGIAAVGAAIYGIKKSADTFEEIGKVVLKLHNLTGLSTKSASEYAAVAKVNDINVKGLLMSFTTLSKNVQAVTNAQDGLTKSAKTQENAFKTLGLPLKDVLAAHGNLNKLLPQVIGAFEHLPGSVNKAATAQALFGRGAKELVPLMHTGALGLKEQLEEAEKYGAAVGNMSSNEFKQFLKSQEEAKYALLGLQMTIGRDVAPALTKLIGGFAAVVKTIHDGTGPIGEAAHVIGTVFGAMFKEMAFAWKVQDEAISKFVGAMKAAVGGVKDAVGGIVGALKGFFNSFYDIGKFLVDGLQKGIEAGAKGLAGVAETIGESVMSPVEEVLGIGSPSKVFHKYGENITEGLAKGIHAGKGAAKDAAVALAASVSGGFTEAAGTNYSKGVEPILAKRLAELGRALHINLTGISGYRTPAHSVAVGGFANDPHTRGEASDTEGIQSVSEATLAKFGLTRPFPGAAEANHIQLLKGATGGSSNSVASQIVAYFVGKGLSPAAAAGIAGNAMQESGDNPNAPGGGLFQYIGSRAASGTGSLAHQLGATWKELSGPYRGALAALRNAKTPGAAAKLFSDLFEKPGIPMLANRERYAQEALSGYGGGSAIGAAAHVEPGLSLSPAMTARLVGLKGAGNTAAGEAGALGRIATGLGEGWQSRRALQVARNGGQVSSLILGQDQATAQSQKRIDERELKAVQAEMRAWAKARDTYVKIARHSHGKAKKEALDRAKEFAAKVATAEQDAKAIGSSITAAETASAEAGNALGRLPTEAYESAVGKISAEERAGLLTPEQAKAAKEAAGNRALAGGYGTLGEEGTLKVKGDLRELSGALSEAAGSAQQFAETIKGASEEAARAAALYAAISNQLGLVETSSITKSLADVLSGQIAGNDYKGQKLTAGVGTAARY